MRADAAQTHYADYQKAVEHMKHGSMAYVVEDLEIPQKELEAWVAYSQKDRTKALESMRAAADMQDKRGQAEVDIPAREMLGDMLLEYGKADMALTEYTASLKLSPNRFNGLYSAGRAAEASGNKDAAAGFYRKLVAQTGNTKSPARPELAHAREFLSQTQVASR
jgi:tetratricopeptide (TPR) repeat protein